MHGRREDQDRAPISPLQPRMIGRSMPLPPVALLVAILGILAGFVLGYGLAPKRAPAPTRATVLAPPRESAPFRSVSAGSPRIQTGESDGSSTRVDLPSGSGLSIAQAIAALEKTGLDPLGSAVLSARLARFGEIETPPRPSDRWVWVFVLRLVFPPLLCGGSAASPAPCPAPTTEMIAIDYHTGGLVEDRVPAIP